MAQDLEAARAEVAQIRQQQEAERARVKKAIAELRRKIDVLQKEKQAAELSGAEGRGKAAAELEAAHAEAAAAEQRVQAAKVRVVPAAPAPRSMPGSAPRRLARVQRPLTVACPRASSAG